MFCGLKRCIVLGCGDSEYLGTADFGPFIENLRGIKDGVKNTFTNVKKSIDNNKTNWQQFTTNVTKWNEDTRQKISQKWQGIKTSVTSYSQQAKASLSSNWQASKQQVVNFNEQTRTAILNKWQGIKTGVSTAVSNVKTSLSTAWDNMKTTASTKWSGIKTTISNKMSDAKTGVSNKLNDMRTAITGFAPKFNEIAAPVIGSISGALDSIRSLVEIL